MPPVVLFLDFDGVLNGQAFLSRQRNHGGERLFDPDNLAALDRLCARLPVAAIVVTSTWRIGRSLGTLRRLLADEGFERSESIVGVTADLGAGIRSRKAEIDTWIAEQGPEIRPVILDDCELDVSEDFVGFFRVDPWTGLRPALVDRIVATLA